MIKIKDLLFIFLALLFVSPALADDAALNKYRNDVLAKSMDQRFQGLLQMSPCKGEDSEIKRTGDYEVLQPVTFAEGSVHPQSGMWYESVNANICGNAMKTRYLIRAQQGKEPRLNIMLPGNSMAAPELQRDAMQHAVVAASMDQNIDAKNCMDMRVTDTKFLNKDESGVWYEDWTVNICGASRDVSMSFIPDATGTTITAKLKE